MIEQKLSQEEEVILLDIETYFPEHTQKESIAKTIDSENTEAGEITSTEDTDTDNEIDEIVANDIVTTIHIDPLEDVEKEDLTDDAEIEQIQIVDNNNVIKEVKSNYKSPIEMLYEIDLDLARANQEYSLDCYTTKHINFILTDDVISFSK
jgi:hypothetical protein